MRYFVGDLHFFHSNIIHFASRPYKTVEEMNEAIIEKWNNTVKAGDTVYILGDFSFANYKETKAIVERLKGQKILIRGNHDERFDTRTFINMGFRDVYDHRIIKLGDGIKTILYHYPYRYPWWKSALQRLYKKPIIRWYQQFFLKDMGIPLIHGHNHNGVLFNKHSINVAWDVNKRLISETEIKNYLLGLK